MCSLKHIPRALFKILANSSSFLLCPIFHLTLLLWWLSSKNVKVDQNIRMGRAGVGVRYSIYIGRSQHPLPLRLVLSLLCWFAEPTTAFQTSTAFLLRGKRFFTGFSKSCPLPFLPNKRGGEPSPVIWNKILQRLLTASPSPLAFIRSLRRARLCSKHIHVLIHHLLQRHCQEKCQNSK